MQPINNTGIRILGLAGFVWLALSVAAAAQVDQTMGTFVSPRKHHFQQSPDGEQQQPPDAQRKQQPAPATAPPPAQPEAVISSTATPPSLLDQPAQPAKIDLTQGQLAIHADNSSLIDIMHRLTADAGMTVDGLSKDQRVFGSYGPGDPQEVISQLLNGTGYNVVMLGRTDTGTPKQVTLTPRAGGIPGGGPAPMRREPMYPDQEEDVDDDTPQPVTANPVEPPPQQPPQQPGGGARTPQQMMQELQQMRQQQMLQMQQQQQENQPQPPPPQQQ
jgi:hypothetical protein